MISKSLRLFAAATKSILAGAVFAAQRLRSNLVDCWTIVSDLVSEWQFEIALARHRLWRTKRPLGKQLRLWKAKFRLSHLQLDAVSAVGADLNDADLSFTSLLGADMATVYLYDAELRHADMRGADLRGADLGRARMMWADLSFTDMRGACLFGAKLEHAIFVDADLRGVDLREAELAGANFCGADLRGAQIRIEDAARADLTHAKLDEEFRRELEAAAYW